MEDLHFLDENEPHAGDELISDDDDSAISFPNEDGLEIGGTEGESEAKSSDWKSLTMRVTMAMIRCAFLEVQVEVEMFADFGDMDGIEDAGDEFVEQEGPLGGELCRLRSSTGSRNRTRVGRRNAVDGTQPMWAAMMINYSPGTL